MRPLPLRPSALRSRLALGVGGMALLAACASPTVGDASFADATPRPDAAPGDAADAGDPGLLDAEPARDAGADLDAQPGPDLTTGIDVGAGLDAQPGPERPAGPSTPPTGRQGHATVQLADGRVLVVGGSVGDSARDFYLYDPATDFWIRGGDLVPALANVSAAQLEDGRVLLSGGADGTRTATSYRSARLLDPVTLQLSPTGAMRDARVGAKSHRITVGPDRGKVLVFGGILQQRSYVQSFELYDPATGTFSVVERAQLPEINQGPLSTELEDGRLLIVAAVLDADRELMGAGFLYDPTTRALRTLTSTPAVMQNASMAGRLADGRVLLVGGRDPSTRMLSAVRYFDPVTETFSVAPALPDARYAAASVLLPDGRFLVLGGSNEMVLVDTVYAFDAATGWSLHPRPLAQPLALLQAVYVNQRVLLIGGQAPGGLVIGTAMFFDP